LDVLVPFKETQKERLKIFFAHICEQYCSYPLNSTFENMGRIYSTICLPEWMIFCKLFGITQEFKSADIGIKALSFIFRKHENIEKRIGF
jgi:hypothetical protein